MAPAELSVLARGHARSGDRLALAAALEGRSEHPLGAAIRAAAPPVDGNPMPVEAFRLPEAPGIGVVFERASGAKCQRCWKILPDVGNHSHPGTFSSSSSTTCISRSRAWS